MRLFVKRTRKTTSGKTIGRRIFSRFTVSEKRSVVVNAHHITNARQWLLCSGQTKT